MNHRTSRNQGTDALKGIHLYVPSQRAMLISAFHSEAQIVTDIQNDYLILALLAIPEVS